MRKWFCFFCNRRSIRASASFSRWRTDNTYQYDDIGTWSYLPLCGCFVVEANHRLFTKSSLIQIGGRVGRAWIDRQEICFSSMTG